MNIVVHNKRELEFDLADLEVIIKDFVKIGSNIHYLIEIRMRAQIWILKHRYSDFDKMHKRLLNDLEYRAADNLPELPPKRLMFNKEADFLKERMKLLNKYLKFIILIYEAIENPILQRFLEIDTRYNPNYEYEAIDIEKNSDRRSQSDCSSMFVEMDKYHKTKFRHVLKDEVAPNGR